MDFVTGVGAGWMDQSLSLPGSRPPSSLPYHRTLSFSDLFTTISYYLGSIDNHTAAPQLQAEYSFASCLQCVFWG